MGQTLSEPVTAKVTSCCKNSYFRVGSSSMQGWRTSMEDSHTHILSLPDDPGTAFFAVYDGHGGAKVSEYAGKHLHKYVTKQDKYLTGDIVEALKQAFLEIDTVMLEEEALKLEDGGTTAIVVMVREDKLFCANVGDSRAVASVRGIAEPLSKDHKPANDEEYDRITSAGGWVQYNRVNGNLALSRALGDYVFKRNVTKKAEEQIVTAYPDVEVRTITPDWEFIVLACDGIWDVMSNQEVVTYIRENIAAGYELEEICENLMMRCLAPDCQMAPLGCDNMTVVIVGLLHEGTYDELSSKCLIPAPKIVDEDMEEENQQEQNTEESNLNKEQDTKESDAAENSVAV